MQWEKSTSVLSLEPGDLNVMAQCKIPLNELVNLEHPNKNIPPLWSVLSYVLLQCHCVETNIWCRYRELLEAARDTRPHYRCRYIPKANGQLRQLYIPNGEIRAQQKFIMENILSALPVDSHAYAYRKGVHIEDCAKPHVNQDVLIHLDLQNFFRSITEDMVFDTLLQETGYNKSLCRFLAQMCCLRGSLPQGAPSSPMLSNIVFRKCDAELADFARRHHLRYSRYSDDLFFSGGGGVAVANIPKEVAAILLAHGFRLNAEKTKVRRRQHRQTVLGLTVNERIQVTREYRRNLLQEVYYLEKFGKNSKGAVAHGDYLSYIQQLQGKVAYALHFDPGNSELRNAHEALTQKIKQHIFLWEHEFI